MGAIFISRLKILLLFLLGSFPPCLCQTGGLFFGPLILSLVYLFMGGLMQLWFALTNLPSWSDWYLVKLGMGIFCSCTVVCH